MLSLQHGGEEVLEKAREEVEKIQEKVEKVEESAPPSKIGTILHVLTIIIVCAFNIFCYLPVAHTVSVIENCMECSRPFRTFVPDSICELPDGSCVSYKDPQFLCPLCDSKGYGGFMNTDLFPELNP